MSAPKLTPQEIVWAYCENEMYSGYPCRTKGCPNCGGPEHADKVVDQVQEWMKRTKNEKPNQ